MWNKALICSFLVLTGCISTQVIRNRTETRPQEMKITLPISFTYIMSFGSFGSGPGALMDPSGISIDQMGDVYVVDTGNDRVQKFDTNGNLITLIGGFGWNKEQFNQPMAIWAENGLDVFITDSQNRRVQRFDNHLNFLENINSITDRDGSILKFGYLWGITASPYGDLYISDTENDLLIKISALSRRGTIFGGFTYGRGDLVDPAGIAVSSNEEVFVCDNGNDRIVRFDSFGSFVSAFGREYLLKPEGLDFGPNGRLLVTDTGHDRIVVFSIDGSFLQEFGVPGNGPGSFRDPRDLVYDGRGNLYILDSGNSRIQKFEVKIIREKIGE